MEAKAEYEEEGLLSTGKTGGGRNGIQILHV